MTTSQWFRAYCDAVSFAGFLNEMRCATPEQVAAFNSRTLARYATVHGAEYADAVRLQVAALLEGVDDLQHGRVE